MCKCKLLKPEKIYKPHDSIPLSSSNFNKFHYKRNRKYLSDSNYLFPVDDDEIDRLQFQHYIYYHVWKSHFSSPIKELLNTDGSKILDVGCGPATWTLEVAAEYPKARFTGIDMIQIYPIETKPLNVEFLQANIVKYGLPYENNTFDFVICRHMNFSYTTKDWENIINEMCRVCKVGGYIEFMEKDVEYEIKKGNFSDKAISQFVKNLKRKNFEPIISPKIKQYIFETKNFPNIIHEKRQIPIGEWGGKIGKYNKEILKWCANNLKNVMVERGYYDDEEWDLTFEKSLQELSDNRVYDNIHRIWARKETESKVKVCNCCKFNFSQLPFLSKFGGFLVKCKKFKKFTRKSKKELKT